MKNYPQSELIDNSPMGLLDALVARIDKVLCRSWWRENEHGNMHTPHVHAQFLPIRKTGDTENRDKAREFPLVQVFHSTGKMADKLDGANLTMIIMFGGWDEHDNRQGWRIPAAMLWAVLQDLLVNPFVGAYEFVAPVEWTIPTDDEPPYWDATLTTTWRCGQIMQQIPWSAQELSKNEGIIFNNEE